MDKSSRPPVFGPDILVRERIGLALSLFETWEARLRQDERVASGLAGLARALEGSRRLMADLGLVKTCRWCEEEEGGSCCGLGIENRYGPVLLLLNLLLGVDLPGDREQLDSCYFLKKNGCCLKVRHVLCVNYLCGRLKETISPEGLNVLQALQGEELNTGFALQETVRRMVES